MKRLPVYSKSMLHGWTTVDDADYDDLVQYLWKASRKGDKTYVVRYVTNGGTVPMHRHLLGMTPGDGLDADHINGDPFDNRRENLRPATRAQNIQNRRGANRGARSQYRGVHYCKQTGRWAATATIDRVQHWLGRHDTEEQAAAAAAAFRAQHMPFSTEARISVREQSTQEVSRA